VLVKTFLVYLSKSPQPYLNNEFTEKAICRSSRGFQNLKLKELENSDLPDDMVKLLREEAMLKSCICHDLAGGVLVKRGITAKEAPAICPGPNLINFKKIVDLKEMVGHIYGRCSLLANSDRPHMFVREIQLQVNYLIDEIKKTSLGLPGRSQKKMTEVKENLIAGINYYRRYGCGDFER